MDVRPIWKNFIDSSWLNSSKLLSLPLITSNLNQVKIFKRTMRKKKNFNEVKFATSLHSSDMERRVQRYQDSSFPSTSTIHHWRHWVWSKPEKQANTWRNISRKTVWNLTNWLLNHHRFCEFWWLLDRSLMNLVFAKYKLITILVSGKRLMTLMKVRSNT